MKTSFEAPFDTGDVPITAGMGTDGKISVVGQSDGKLAFARYNSDGSLDTSFGAGGKVVTQFGNGGTAIAAAFQPDGKVVTAGFEGTTYIVGRYDADGSVDTSFGSDGIVKIPSCCAVLSVGLQPDGKILAAGSTDNGFALFRFMPDGTPDPSLGGDGHLVTPIGFNAGAWAVAVQTDAKILLSGEASSSFATARYNPDGSLDPTFGNGGKVITAVGSGSRANGLALQPDGKIVIAGYSSCGQGYARYNANGTLDPSFGNGGTLRLPLSSGCSAGVKAVAVQPDGKIVGAGPTDPDPLGTGSPSEFELTRLNADGTLDATFGSNGITTTNVGGYQTPADSVAALVLQPDGRLIAVGQGGSIVSCGKECFRPTHVDFALARYDPDGSLDASFGSQGTAITNFGTRSAPAAARSKAAFVQPDGRIVVVGQAEVAGGVANDFAVARYRRSGRPDRSFGDSGKVVTDLGLGNDTSTAAAVRGGDGRILAAGGGGGDFALIRYRSDGSLDPAFGTGGVATTDFGGFDEITALSVSATARSSRLGPSAKDPGESASLATCPMARLIQPLDIGARSPFRCPGARLSPKR